MHNFYFPGLQNVFIGQFRPYILTEVDCESLFSQSVYLSHPRRANTKIRTFARLVIGTHCLGRIYCDLKKVEPLYKTRHHHKDWDDNDERDDVSFLKLEKDIYEQMYPQNKQIKLDDDGDK